MYNYNNLSDFEFEILCKDIMQKKMGIKLYTFQKGRDGGIDVTDDPKNRKVIIQVKHYINSKYRYTHLATQSNGWADGWIEG